MPDWTPQPEHRQGPDTFAAPGRVSGDPERVELVAEAICPRTAGACDFCKSAARRIIAFPEEVLSGLVRADVATREWRGDQYRYVTPWKETP